VVLTFVVQSLIDSLIASLSVCEPIETSFTFAPEASS